MHNVGEEPNLYSSFENQYLLEWINHKNFERISLPSSVDISRNNRQEVNASQYKLQIKSCVIE